MQDATAEGEPAADYGDCGDCGACDECCDSCSGTGGLVFVAEAAFFRYHRADGVRIGDDEGDDDVEFDFEASPRITLGYAGSDGLGVRVRWWEYDEEAESFDGQGEMVVDTYTFDVELFDTVQLDCN